MKARFSRCLVYALVTLASITFEACATGSRRHINEAQAQKQCTEPGTCATLTPKPGVVLSPREKCWVSLLKSRCNAHDHCILKCLLNGEARNFGGGCSHPCGHIYTSVGGELIACPNSPVPGWEQCEHLSNVVN